MVPANTVQVRVPINALDTQQEIERAYLEEGYTLLSKSYAVSTSNGCLSTYRVFTFQKPDNQNPQIQNIFQQTFNQ